MSENVSEYVRALIRRDQEQAFKAQLHAAASAPESDYIEITANDIFKRVSVQSA